jgi:hypothetical protein
MTIGAVIPANSGLFPDARGDDRWLRVTWHPAHNVFVLSIWRNETCSATFQLDRTMSSELVADVVRSLSAPTVLTWSDRQLSTPSAHGRRRSATLRQGFGSLRQKLQLRRRGSS